MIKEIQREIKDFSRQGQADLQRLVRRTNRTLTQPVTITRRGLIGAAVAAVAVYEADNIAKIISPVAKSLIGTASALKDQTGRTLSRVKISIEDTEDPNAPAMKNRPGVLTQVAQATEAAKTPTESPRTATPPRPSPSPSRLAMANTPKPSGSSEKPPVIEYVNRSEAQKRGIDMDVRQFYLKPLGWTSDTSQPHELLRCIKETDIAQALKSLGIDANTLNIGNLKARVPFSKLPEVLASLCNFTKEDIQNILKGDLRMFARVGKDLIATPAIVLDNIDEVNRRRTDGERNIFHTEEEYDVFVADNQALISRHVCINFVAATFGCRPGATVTPSATIPPHLPPAQVPPTQPPSIETQVPPTQPPATSTPTREATQTPQKPPNTATATRESTQTPQPTPPDTATSTEVPNTATATRESTQTPQPTPPDTATATIPAATATREATNTPQINPEDTATPIPPTSTVVASSPTNVPTIAATREATNTPQTNPEASATPVPPASTNTPSSASAAPTNTPVPAATNIPGRESTSTPGREPTRAPGN